MIFLAVNLVPFNVNQSISWGGSVVQPFHFVGNFRSESQGYSNQASLLSLEMLSTIRQVLQ